MRLGLTEKDIKVLENHTAKSLKLGLDVKMISGDEAREICPYMSKEVVAASWCPTDGHANPLKATLGFYRKALELGVTFITGVKVEALEKVKGRVRRVLTDDGVYEADQILLCAGYESRKIAMVLYNLPLDAIVGMYEAILGGVSHVPTENALFNCLLVFNIPFTLAKGLLDTALCFLIYKPLSPLLHR